MAFHQEPEPAVGTYGTAQEYAAAYRYIVNRFAADGVTNVSWVWAVEGYSGHYAKYQSGLYPGDDVIDWIGWDPYNWYLCHNTTWKSFREKVSVFYNWLLQNGHGNKPFMLSEWGSRESDVDPQAKGTWFTDARDTMKSGHFPNLKALVYFDSNTSVCRWSLDSSQASIDGFKSLANDPFFGS
jgi:beta-mannanase